MGFMKKVLIILMVCVLGAFILLKGFFSMVEKNTLYHPFQEESYYLLESLEIDEVSFTSPLGNIIYAGFHQTGADEVILFFHGNAGSINANKFNLEALLRIEKNFLMIDYPGYGKSSGTPSEESLYDAGRAAYQFLIDNEYRPEQIVIDGQSLGGAVAAQIALEKDAKSLILESTFTSTHRMAAILYPWVPKWILPSNKFDTISKVGPIDETILIIHGREDHIIPFDEAIELREASKPNSYLLALPGVRHNQDTILPEAIQKNINEFVATTRITAH